MGAGLAAAPAPGGGQGGDNRNTGPRGKINDVKDVSKTGSQVGDSGMIFSAGETTGTPDDVAPSNVPYTKVLPDYKKAAESAMRKEKVPAAYKTRVKDYFERLDK